MRKLQIWLARLRDRTSLTQGVNQAQQDTFNFKLKPEAAAIMKDFTGSHIGQALAITSDREVILYAIISGVIEDKGEITAQTKEDYNLVQAYLKSGPLPLSVKLESFSKP